MQRSLIMLAAALLVPAGLAGQQAGGTIATGAFLASPSGARLATLDRAAVRATGRRDGEWREVVLDGWIWNGSVRTERRDGHDLRVSAAGGENLRVSPGGNRVARLLPGMLLDEVTRRNGWVHARRTGWVQGLTTTASSPAGRAPPGAGPARPAAPVPGPATRSTRTAAAAPDPPPAERASRASARVGYGGTVLLAAPDGDTIARLPPLAPAEVVGRQGNWSRIRVEGWVWSPSLATGNDTAAVLKEVAPEALASSPGNFRGRIIEWSVQFISLDRAEKIRTDFFEGEPYILARGPGDSPGLAYIAVPPERLPQVQRLVPLQRLTIRARVRSGRSPLMGAPVLELIELVP